MNGFGKKCKIEKNETLGRFVIAAEDIGAGETLLLECPVLIMPIAVEKRCVNCWRIADDVCNKCQVFPLCDHCTDHDQFDCEFFTKATDFSKGFLMKHIELYGPLKYLLIGENPQTRKLYNSLMLLESHQNDRRNTEVWLENSKKIVEPFSNSGIGKYFVAIQQEEQKSTFEIDEELLQKICGQIDVNSFEIRAPDAGGSMRAIYLQASLLSHQCNANTSIAIDDSHRMKIYANRNVKAGEMLHYCYTNPLLGTNERRHLLKIGKYFDCNCQRCEDPTELNSHMSSLLCTDNGKCGISLSTNERGFVVQTDNGSAWKCQRCDFTIESDNVKGMLKEAKNEILAAQGDVRKCEMLIQKFSRIFHRNHYLIIDLKQNIAAFLRSILMNLACRPGKAVYERKIQLCEDILEVLRIVQPGISRLKAIALYEMYTPFVELNRMRFGENEITDLELMERLIQGEAMLKESMKMLLYEPPNTPEGCLAKSMIKELKDLQSDIQSLMMDQKSARISEIVDK